jgi:hypothetical protein
VIVAVAATLALAVPSRNALTERWLRANPAHTLARLNSVPPGFAHGTATAPPDLRALAQHELDTAGRYRLSQPVRAPAKSWWERALEWLADRWQKGWNAVFGRVHVGKQQAASIGDVLLLLVGLLLIFVVMRLVREIYLAREAASTLFEPLAIPPSPRALYKRACDRANAGDYGNAALLLFAATVAFLDRRGAVDASSTATVGDLRRSLRARYAAWLTPFDTVAAPFVQTAYAERPIDEAQWQRAEAAYAILAASSRAESRGEE